MTLLDYGILALVGLAIFLAIRRMRTHKSSCCGGCTGDCAHCAATHKK